MSGYLFHVDPPAVADAGDEFSIQKRFLARMRTVAPSVRLVATPNAGKRTMWEAQRAKGEGMATGWPDLACYWSNGLDDNAIPGIAMIEFKTKTGRLSDAQIDNLNWLHRHGFPVGVFRSVSTAEAWLRQRGAPFLMEQAA
jgi:hypothetical protein